MANGSIFHAIPASGTPNPVPLWFRVPKLVLRRTFGWYYCELDPGFLCFETFYQSVAAAWPKDYNVIDVGGYMGVQGWLFLDHQAYVDVDTVGMEGRCALPPNGRHVVANWIEYIDQFRLFRADTSQDLFVCSGVPNKTLRELVRTMPNHVEWYPGQEMHVSGPFGDATRAEFDRLNASGWELDASKAALESARAENLWKSRL